MAGHAFLLRAHMQSLLAMDGEHLASVIGSAPAPREPDAEIPAQ
jgi:hypothetical protein